MTSMKKTRYLEGLRTGSPEPGRMRTFYASYWYIAVFFAFVLVLGALAYGGWQLYGVMYDTSDTGADTSGGAQKTALDTAQLDTVLQAIANRQDRYNTLKASAPAAADPGQ